MNPAARAALVRYTRTEHQINPDTFDRRALRIVERLDNAGFDAYLVGGCIRDALTGHAPKDFDIATNARPEEIAQLFRNCRLIGRRFRLAHIHFGRDIIEVATFRADADDQMKTDSHGYVIEDNHYGTLQDDVGRRDFTINSLYYDVAREEIIDYLGAMADIRAGLIRLIGDPHTRYGEDPVRMLRAARFAAKLAMPLAAETAAAIGDCHQELGAVPAARLFDEVQKLFMNGYGVKSYDSLRALDLFAELFPDVDRVFSDSQSAFADYADRIVRAALVSTDTRVAEGKPVTIAFLFAAFLWPVYQLRYQRLLEQRDNWHSAMHEAVELVHLAACKRVSIPVRLRGMIREIWTLQARFELAANSAKKTHGLLAHPRFRAAYDFLLIRAAAGEPLDDAVNWWSAAQQDRDSRPECATEEHSARGNDAARGNRRRNRASGKKS